MYPRSKKRFTFKIISSYVALGILAVLAAFFIYNEFKTFVSGKNSEGDSAKLLHTNRLLSNLYEAENLSKLALKTKKPDDLKAYAVKVDSINTIIDSLKPLVKNPNFLIPQLDSVQALLQQKVFNSAELRKLMVENENSTSFDAVLEAFHRMEVEMGRITPESFVPNFQQLPPSTQKSIREYVALLNKNIPSAKGNVDANNIDSILQVSRSILNKAITEAAANERSLIQKEFQIYRTDLELSQKMRSIIAGFEREMAQKVQLDNANQRLAMQRTTRLAGGALLLGLLIVIFFTFMISKDYWKVQRYREQLEEEKKYSEFLLKSREQLISTVSHDLRTPLNTISGYSELMEHSGLSGKQLNYLKNVRSASGYVENLVNDLLDYSKLEAGRVNLERVPFILSNLIRETSLHFREVNSKKEVELQLEIDENLEKPIVSDPFRIRQILTNLVGNAFKFTQKGHVKISAVLEDKRDEQWVRIRVKDTGIGIKPEKQQLIFQEFAQANESTEKKYGGYGLGLTISKKLTELLNGRLYLESVENEGSIFTVRIPVAFGEMPIAEDLPQEKTLEGFLTLCAIDDDTNMLKLLEDICQVHAIDIKTYTNFKEIEEVESISCDVVLTDIQMPGIDGFSVLKRLRELGYENPVIAMTGQQITDKSVYTGAGFTDVLQKPFSNTSFLDILGKVGHSINGTGATTTSIPGSQSTHFSVNNIAPFLDSPQAVLEVLEVFLENTEKNMELLFSHIGSHDFSEIRAISHKMLPMFRQLEVRKAIPLLEELEHLSDDAKGKKVFGILTELQKIIHQLNVAIKDYLFKLPTDID
ncbi:MULTISPECIES: hybrid sensor histidine kinase/response regulator [Flagellimonas]|uniref:histidine kinase n=1 Tax=Flagellimonas hadalis TaxID=2597517 RepID=A0A5N5IKQ5_9FLAO|nr:hybrid sensor histidine kinase/response regulator [Allomuricauda hadalis]KAB5485103.1 response regulator [Allomuricauda hadalis]